MAADRGTELRAFRRFKGKLIAGKKNTNPSELDNSVKNGYDSR